MEITVIAFGQIAGITGSQFLIRENLPDTNALRDFLHQKYPELSRLKYALAVDKKIVIDNIELNKNVTIALLPPFSGG